MTEDTEMWELTLRSCETVAQLQRIGREIKNRQPPFGESDLERLRVVYQRCLARLSPKG